MSPCRWSEVKGRRREGTPTHPKRQEKGILWLFLIFSLHAANQRGSVHSVQLRLSPARRPAGASQLNASSSTGGDQQGWHDVSFIIVPSIFIVLLLSISYLLSAPTGRGRSAGDHKCNAAWSGNALSRAGRGWGGAKVHVGTGC